MHVRHAPRLIVWAAAFASLFACTPNRVVDGRGAKPAAGASWERCALAPSARQEVAAAVLDEQIFVAGGLAEGGRATTRVDSYDTRRDRWIERPPLPTPLDHAMGVSWRDEFVVLGGNGPTGAGVGVHVLRAGRWERLPDLLTPRAAGAAVTLGEQIVVIGGRGDRAHVIDVEIFDGRRWRRGPAIRDVRDHLAAVTDGEVVYAVGGRRGGAHFASFDLTDVGERRTRSLPDMPTARSGLGAAFVGGKIVAVGGEGPRMFPEVESYDVAERTWERLPNMGIPRHGVGVAAVGSKVFALLGGTEVGLGASAACEVLDLG